MSSSHRRIPEIAVLAVLAVVLAAVAAAAHAQGSGFFNLTTHAPLRPGIYGRIEVRGDTLPPLIYQHPVVATDTFVPATARPVYLYVPPGQVRRWKQSCGHWKACDQPVLFVRMEDSPSRWGRWRQWREQMAHAADPQ